MQKTEKEYLLGYDEDYVDNIRHEKKMDLCEGHNQISIRFESKAEYEEL